MKQFIALLIIAMCFSGIKLMGQQSAQSISSGIWIEQASKQNKKYIRYFDAGKKANQEKWITQPTAVDIGKGLYRIRLTNTGALITNKILIRKVEHNSTSSTESSVLLPASYYRVEFPSKEIVDIYFSAGANRFFADMPGYVLISGLFQKNNQAMPDLAVGVNHYLAVTEKKKGKIATLLAIR
ncbi:MAG: hypothetical protein FGM61_09625 [Sediminibacterium sp.]|nr:hypothetical protein [Sediminibacterium sp.]